MHTDTFWLGASFGQGKDIRKLLSNEKIICYIDKNFCPPFLWKVMCDNYSIWTIWKKMWWEHDLQRRKIDLTKWHGPPNLCLLWKEKPNGKFKEKHALKYIIDTCSEDYCMVIVHHNTFGPPVILFYMDPIYNQITIYNRSKPHFITSLIWLKVQARSFNIKGKEP